MYGCCRQPGCVSVDISECVRTPDICGAAGQCVDTPGSYRCNCTEGLQLSPDQQHCVGLYQVTMPMDRATFCCRLDCRLRCCCIICQPFALFWHKRLTNARFRLWICWWSPQKLKYYCVLCSGKSVFVNAKIVAISA